MVVVGEWVAVGCQWRRWVCGLSMEEVVWADFVVFVWDFTVALVVLD
jgi:hypothetical protein